MLLARRSQIRVARTVPFTCSATTWHMIQTLPPLATLPTRALEDDGDRRMLSGVPPVRAMPVPATLPAAGAAPAGAGLASRLPAIMAAAASTARAVRR